MRHVTDTQAAEIAPGTMRAIDVEHEELLIANVGGSLHAMRRKCTHMGENLCAGKLEGNLVICPRHGARFDVTTGKAIGKAKLLFMSTLPKNLATFRVTIDDGLIAIDV